MCLGWKKCFVLCNSDEVGINCIFLVVFIFYRGYGVEEDEEGDESYIFGDCD